MMQFTVSLPDDLRQGADAQAARNGYADVAEYLRDLIVRDLAERPSDLDYLRARWNEGVHSGMIDDEPEDVIEQIIAEMPARDVAA